MEFFMNLLSDIRTKIDKADAAYYRHGNLTIMTDSEYDSLKRQLKELCPEDERLSRVGFVVEQSESKIKHVYPMGSLDNTEDGIDGLHKFLESIDALSKPLVMSHKIDGSSITASYRLGKLVRVATRGNGIEGTDITKNGIMFRNLPTTIQSPLELEVRGEAILFRQEFDKIMKDEEEASNPRNVGNGILGRDDGTDSDKINFIAFDVKEVSSTESTSSVNSLKVSSKFTLLTKLGFDVVSHKVVGNYDEAIAYYDTVYGMRNSLDYEIDGIVIMPDDYSVRMSIDDDQTRLRPKYARAIKFPHLSGIATLEDVTITVGHTGAIIPTAKISKTRVGGVYVSNVLLNNWEEIKRLNVNIGDKVKVVLAGDIIPKITEVVEKLSEGSFPEPQCCMCSKRHKTTRLIRDGEKGAVTYCCGALESDCDIASVEKIKHWIGGSKTGIGILGIGDSIVEQLVLDGLLKNAADLYKLDVDTLAKVKIGGRISVGKSRAKTIIDNIKDKSIVKLHEFLGCLGVPFLGRRRAQILIKDADGKLDNIDNWLDISYLSSVLLGITGETMTEAICAGIDSNMSFIKEMLEQVKIGDKSVGLTEHDIVAMKFGEAFDGAFAEPVVDKKFEGLSFCFTGTRECIEEVERLGGEIKSGVSKNLSILVQADPTSMTTKTQKAESYGVRIISLDFLKQALAGEVDLREELAL